MMLRLGGVAVIGLVIGQLAVRGQARAEDQPPSSTAPQQPAQEPSPPPAPATAPAPPPARPSPDQQWGMPPPGYGGPPPAPGTTPPPPGYPPPGYREQNHQLMLMTYEAQRKHVGLSVILEILFPGVGSIYADHAVGALITWICTLAGIGLVVWGASELTSHHHDRMDSAMDHRDDDSAIIGLTAGSVLILGGRIYGLADSYLSADSYNLKLRQRLGIPTGMAFGVGRIGSGQVVTYGPRLSFTF